MSDEVAIRVSAAARPAPSVARTATMAAILLAVVAFVPTFLLSDYHLFQLTMVAVYAIAILGLAILTGFNGQISLGHGAFFAIGAYIAAILISKFAVNPWLTIPVAAVVCLGAGFLFGLPALRLEGLYLALATFALAVATPQLLKYKHAEGWTGGVQGIVILDKPEAPFDLPISQDRWLYLVTLAIVVVMLIVARNLTRGRVGRAIVAIRDIDPGTASARESTRWTRVSKASSESPVRATMVLRLSGLLSRVTVFSVWSLNANRSMRPMASHLPIASSASRL